MQTKMREIVRAMRVDGVHLLDWSLDADHNRSVVTIAGSPEAVVEAAVRGAGKAARADRPDEAERGASAHWGGGRDSVCAGERDFAGAVRDAGAAGGDGDLAAVWGAGVLL